MARWAPQRRDVIAQLVDELLLNYGRGRATVAIDGAPELTGPIAADVAEELERRGHGAVRGSIADFARTDDDGEGTGAAAYVDGYDYDALRAELVGPFRTGTSPTSAAGSADRGSAADGGCTVADDALLLVDGPYLLRPELRGLWNVSIHIDGAEDGGAAEDRRRYTAETDLRRVATILMDASDPEHPRRVFADSC